MILSTINVLCVCIIVCLSVYVCIFIDILHTHIYTHIESHRGMYERMATKMSTLTISRWWDSNWCKKNKPTQILLLTLFLCQTSPLLTSHLPHNLLWLLFLQFYWDAFTKILSASYFLLTGHFLVLSLPDLSTTFKTSVCFASWNSPGHQDITTCSQLLSVPTLSATHTRSWCRPECHPRPTLLPPWHLSLGASWSPYPSTCSSSCILFGGITTQARNLVVCPRLHPPHPVIKSLLILSTLHIKCVLFKRNRIPAALIQTLFLFHLQ